VLMWSALPAAAGYNTYRGSFGPGAGSYNHACFEVGDATGDGPTQSTDNSVPPAGAGFYYLVSGKNACGEGGLGTRSDGASRPNTSPCS